MYTYSALEYNRRGASLGGCFLLGRLTVLVRAGKVVGAVIVLGNFAEYGVHAFGSAMKADCVDAGHLIRVQVLNEVTNGITAAAAVETAIGEQPNGVRPDAFKGILQGIQRIGRSAGIFIVHP